jgi:hypothetical protein
MKIYLAGKVRKGCWRHSVVDGMSDPLSKEVGHTCSNAHDDDELSEMSRGLTFPVMRNAIFGAHDYVGPYFISCDHGCWHGPDGHGLNGLPQPDIVGMCLAGVMRADLVFAWVDTLDCYGTIAEVGFARGQGKKVVIAGPEQYRDMWFLYKMAHHTLTHDNPVEALREAIRGLAA